MERERESFKDRERDGKIERVRKNEREWGKLNAIESKAEKR